MTRIEIDLTDQRGTARNIATARHGGATGRTTPAGKATEFLIAWTFCFAHFVLRHALVVEMTIPFGIWMNAIAFIDT